MNHYDRMSLAKQPRRIGQNQQAYEDVPLEIIEVLIVHMPFHMMPKTSATVGSTRWYIVYHKNLIVT